MINTINNYAKYVAGELTVKSINIFDVSKGSKEKGFYVEGYAITSDIDLQEDILTLQALKGAANSLTIGSTVFYNHDTSRPIGKIVAKKLMIISNSSGKLWVRVFISSTEQEIITKIKENIINKFSFTGRSLKNKVFNRYNSDGEVIAHEVNDLTIYEVSLVGLPANPKAKTTGYEVKKNFIIKNLGDNKMENIEKKIVTPVKTPMGNATTWDGTKSVLKVRRWASSDGSGNKDKVDFKKYAKAFVYFDEKNSKLFTAYKLPHHSIESGTLVVEWDGVKAAMGSLLGARGGVQIPKNERSAAYKHLAIHYKQFSKFIPKFKSLEEIMEEETEIKKTLIPASKAHINIYDEDITKAIGDINSLSLNQEINLLVKTKVVNKAEFTINDELYGQLGLAVIDIVKLDVPAAIVKKAIVPNEEKDNKVIDLKVSDKEVITTNASDKESDKENKTEIKPDKENKKSDEVKKELEKEKEIKEVKKLKNQVIDLQKQLEVKETEKKEIKKNILDELKVVRTRKGLIIRADKIEKPVDIEKENIDMSKMTATEIIENKEAFNSLSKDEKNKLITKSILDFIRIKK